MRKIYLSLLFVAGIYAANAQRTTIPNSSFENWETRTFQDASYEAPVDWDAGSFCAAFEGNNAQCVVSGKKSTDAKSGDLAVQVSAEGFPVILFDLDFVGTEIPTGFQFWAKSNITSSEDLAKIQVILHNDFLFYDEDFIAYDSLLIDDSKDSYTFYQGNINLLSTQSFEHISVMISVESESETSTITVDDFELVYGNSTTGINDAVEDYSIVNSTVVNSEIVFDPLVSSYELYDLTGSLLLSGTGTNADVSYLTTGIYVAKIITENGSIMTTKIIKN